MERRSRLRHADAAVITDQAAPGARVVPAGARLVKAGKRKTVILGYLHKPARLRQAFSLPRQRLHEIEALIRHRHGGPADTDDADPYLAAAAPHLETRDDRIAWARRWTPRLSVEDVLAEVGRIDELRRVYRADKLGRMLRLTRSERDQLGITTIGAVDLNKRQRTAERKMAARKRERLRREVKGAKPRSLSASHLRPWEAKGCSRRTWERRRQAEAVANSCANESGPKTPDVANWCAPIESQPRTNLRHAPEPSCKRGAEPPRRSMIADVEQIQRELFREQLVADVVLAAERSIDRLINTSKVEAEMIAGANVPYVGHA